MTDNVNMNTLAVIYWLEQPEIVLRWTSVMRLWSRENFLLWLRNFCIDNGPVTPEVANRVIDWKYVVDHLFLSAVVAADNLEAAGDVSV